MFLTPRLGDRAARSCCPCEQMDGRSAESREEARGGRREAARPDPRSYLIALLGGETGLRAGEIVALEWADVDLDRRQIQRYSHLSPAALDATNRPLDNRTTLPAAGDSLERPKG